MIGAGPPQRDQIEWAISHVQLIMSGAIGVNKVEWDNPLVREAIVAHFLNYARLKRDSEHLEIVKSVFRGGT